jgi:hypothetical protein
MYTLKADGDSPLSCLKQSSCPVAWDGFPVGWSRNAEKELRWEQRDRRVSQSARLSKDWLTGDSTDEICPQTVRQIYNTDYTDTVNHWKIVSESWPEHLRGKSHLIWFFLFPSLSKLYTTLPPVCSRRIFLPYFRGSKMINQPHSPLSIAALTDQQTYHPTKPPSDTPRSPPLATTDSNHTAQPPFQPSISSPTIHLSPTAGANGRSAEGMQLSIKVSSQLSVGSQWWSSEANERTITFWARIWYQVYSSWTLTPIRVIARRCEWNYGCGRGKFIVGHPII